MGVRESAAQQPEGEMRLQDMTIEAREKEPVVFDPETDISEEQWKQMLEWIGFYYDSVKLNESYEDIALSSAVTGDEFKGYFMCLKILSPERTEKYVQKHGEKFEKSYFQEAEKFWKTGARMYIKNQLATEIAGLRDAEIRGADKGYWQKMVLQARQEKAWDRFSRLAMEMRLMIPGSKIDISHEDWQDMKDRLTTRNTNTSAARMAFAMKILAAHEVKVTSAGGIEIIENEQKDFQEKTPERPVRREF